jgi:hypothetical protein
MQRMHLATFIRLLRSHDPWCVGYPRWKSAWKGKWDAAFLTTIVKNKRCVAWPKQNRADSLTLMLKTMLLFKNKTITIGPTRHKQVLFSINKTTSTGTRIHAGARPWEFGFMPAVLAYHWLGFTPLGALGSSDTSLRLGQWLGSKSTSLLSGTSDFDSRLQYLHAA